jgi:hypothetical protein
MQQCVTAIDLNQRDAQQHRSCHATQVRIGSRSTTAFPQAKSWLIQISRDRLPHATLAACKRFL